MHGTSESELTWHEVFKELRADLNEDPRSILVGLSAHLTNEEIADMVMTLSGLGVQHFCRLADETSVAERVPYDGLLKHRDVSSNAIGFEKVMGALSVPWLRQRDSLLELASGKWRNLWLLGLQGNTPPGVTELLAQSPKGTKVVLHATSRLPSFEVCSLVLPNVSSFEKTGTLVNALGRLQKNKRALPRQYTSRDGHGVVFGIFQGNDKQAFPSERARDLFESFVGPKLIGGEWPKWGAFPILGISLERDVSRVGN
jgi:anaerobic selenocysteine-containing dehydrogenase